MVVIAMELVYHQAQVTEIVNLAGTQLLTRIVKNVIPPAKRVME